MQTLPNSAVRHVVYHTRRTDAQVFLTAYPFALDEAQAKSCFGMYAAGLVKTKLFPSVVGRFFPEIMEPLQPKRIVPVYFPAWVVDAEVEVKASAGTIDVRFQYISSSNVS